MADNPVEGATDVQGLPVAPSMELALQAAAVPVQENPVDLRVAFVALVCVGLGLIAAVAAKVLVSLIGLFTNLAFFGRVSTVLRAPTGNHLGWWVVGVPVIGGVIVGL